MEEEIKIENNIPLVSIQNGRMGIYYRAFEKMDEGDSFVVPVKKRNNVVQSGRRFGKVVTRSIGEGQLRVWLVKKRKENK